MKAYSVFSTRVTPQSEAIPGRAQVKNNAGGYVFHLDDWKAFERFLILGSEGGSYYVGEQTLTKDNAIRTMGCIVQDGRRAVDVIVRISNEGRAPKNDAAIFALALAASTPDPATRQRALDALPQVCRIPTHLFHFVTCVRKMRGMGRGLKTALARWYQDQNVSNVAYHACKYQQRDGMSNADVLRLSHPKTADPARQAVYRWIVDGMDAFKMDGTKAYTSPAPMEGLPAIITNFELAKTSTDVSTVARLIRDHNLSREMVPTEMLKDPRIWEALLEKMPFGAMVRNLGNMSKCGLLKPMSAASKMVVERLHDEGALKSARIHPIGLLVAMKTYSSGHGLRGTGEWEVDGQITDALDDAFYLSFKHVAPTGKRILYGIDVSASMAAHVGQLPITCCEGATAMAMASAKVESIYHVMAFDQGFRRLAITNKSRLDDALKLTRNINGGGTDCALPMMWALQNKVEVDAFVVLTDNETWAGRIHPSQALKQYREGMGIEAKEIVVGMVATPFTIADPADPLTMDVVGFDTATPQVMSAFIAS